MKNSNRKIADKKIKASTCVCVRVYVCACVYMFVYIHVHKIYVEIYTYTHKQQTNLKNEKPNVFFFHLEEGNRENMKG